MNAQQQASIRRAQQLRRCHLLSVAMSWRWNVCRNCTAFYIRVATQDQYRMKSRSLGALAFPRVSCLHPKNRRIEESKLGLSVPHLRFPDHHPDRNQKIEESKNRRIPNWSWSCDNRQTSERVYLFLRHRVQSSTAAAAATLVVVSLRLWANHIASKAAFSSEAFTDPHINLHFAE
jgi:hypothetical protein